MLRPNLSLTSSISLIILVSSALFETIVPRLSVEDLIDRSDVVVAGEVTRSWAAWDASHKYIWTHHDVAVSSSLKGAAGSSVELAEPGGAVGAEGMTISGSVAYQVGDKVVVFLQKMPNGYLRTAGAGQGRFALDSAGKIHGASPTSVEFIESSAGSASATRLEALNGLSVNELAVRIAARIRQSAQRQGAR